MDNAKITRLNKLFVGGISPDVTEDEMRSHFTNFGKIIDLVIIRDKESKQSRGFGFVTFEHKSAMLGALNQQHYLAGKPLDLKEAKPKKASKEDLLIQGVAIKKIFVGGIPKEVTKKMFREHFEKYGNISDIVLIDDRKTSEPRGFGFVCFEHPSAVQSVICDYANHCLAGKWVEVKPALPRSIMPPTSERGQYIFEEELRVEHGEFQDSERDLEDGAGSQISASLPSSYTSSKHANTATTKQSSGYAASQRDRQGLSRFARYERADAIYARPLPGHQEIPNQAFSNQTMSGRYHSSSLVQQNPVNHVNRQYHSRYEDREGSGVVSNALSNQQEGPDEVFYSPTQMYPHLEARNRYHQETMGSSEVPLRTGQDIYNHHAYMDTTDYEGYVSGPPMQQHPGYYPENNSKTSRPNNSATFQESMVQVDDYHDFMAQSPLAHIPSPLRTISQRGHQKNPVRSEQYQMPQSPFSVASSGARHPWKQGGHKEVGSVGLSPHYWNQARNLNSPGGKIGPAQIGFDSPSLDFFSPAYDSGVKQAFGEPKSSAWQPRRVLKAGALPLSRYFDPGASKPKPSGTPKSQKQSNFTSNPVFPEGTSKPGQKSRFSLKPHLPEGEYPAGAYYEPEATAWTQPAFDVYNRQPQPEEGILYQQPEAESYTDDQDWLPDPVNHHESQQSVGFPKRG